MIKGIDVSKWQGNIDWGKVKASGIDFAIIRATFGSPGRGFKDDGFDVCFKANAEGAQKAGMPVGAYHYCYAKTVDQAKIEAQHFLNVIKGYKFEYPVVLDMEDPSLEGLGKNLLTNIVITFLEILEHANYFAAIYASKSWLTSVLDDSKLTGYCHWVAQYNPTCTYPGAYAIWQYSSSGSVPGISGNVDMDYCYRDLETEIKTRFKNGFTKPIPTSILKVGSKGADVKTLQAALNAKGFNCGAVDGIFGVKTLAGVKKFQAAKKLIVDGIVGPKTRGALLS